MWSSYQVLQAATLIAASSAAAFGQLTLSYDKLDGADPGFIDVPAHRVIVDCHVDVAPTDAWLVAGIAGDVDNAAVLHYSPEPDDPATQGLEYLTSPGIGQRYVTFVSSPRPRNADARFNDTSIFNCCALCPGSPGGPLANATTINAAWLAVPPITSGSPSVDGYIMRLALDISGTGYTPAQCRVYVPASAPALAVPLFVADHCDIGMSSATFDEPALIGNPWGIYAVPWGVLGDFYELPGSDAPELPGFSELIMSVGFRNVGRITGNLGLSDVDMFAFRVDDPGRFSATTMQGAATDTQLFLFDEDGRAIVFNDNAAGQVLQSLITPQFVQNPGTYYLAIARYNRDPINPNSLPIWTDTPRDGQRPPNGQGANNPFVAGWSGGTNAGGNYAIYLTGATTLCDGDVDGNGFVELADLALVLTNYGRVNGARFNQGNIDGDADVDLDDLAGLLSRFGTSCQ